MTNTPEPPRNKQTNASNSLENEKPRISQRSRSKIAKKQLDKRNSLWPDLDEKRIWKSDDKHPGYFTIPRTMPIIMEIINGLSQKCPTSTVYFDLWCRCFDDFFLTITNSREHAFFSGFSGQRAILTWEKRMHLLSELRFIDIKPGPNGDISYVIIWNPYLIIKEHWQKKTLGMRDDLYNALRSRITDIGAVDLSNEHPQKEKNL